MTTTPIYPGADTGTELVFEERTAGLEPIPTERPKKGAAGRKSDLARIEEKVQIELLKKEAADKEARDAERAEIEAKRAKREQPDTIATLRLSKILGAIALATSFTISYFTMVAVAGWMRLPWEPLSWIVPGAIEVLILFSTLDYIVSESRKKKSGRGPFWAIVGISFIAVVANASHTITEWGSGFGSIESWVGLALSAAAPLIVVYVSKRFAALIYVTAGESK